MMNRSLLGKAILISGLIFLLNGAVNAAEILLRTAPPAIRVEVRPKAPHAHAVWVPGHRVWCAGKYSWTGGHWIKHRPGFVYVPGHWVKRPGGWVWIEGYWKRG